MKKGMCRGCDCLTKKEQVQFFEEDGRTKIDPPRRVMKPFCGTVYGYGLHLEYIDRIHEGEAVCVRYRHEGTT